MRPDGGVPALVEEAAELALERGGTHEEMAAEFIDRLFVLSDGDSQVVPGRVSTEVAASLSFDTGGRCQKPASSFLYMKGRVWGVNES